MCNGFNDLKQAGDMDIQHIKELMALMENSSCSKMSIKDPNGLEIHLEKIATVSSSTVTLVEKEPAAKAAHPVKSAEPIASTRSTINSPMVGTFYRSPSPKDPPFVNIGDHVNEQTVVCIVEAMKVMNEIKAQKKGKIVELLVDNLRPVEFGTPLFRIE
jgi:acetyl-CoA carboxylase biotin carboxyl carrier protein